MREKKVEQYLVKRVKKAGGRCVKFIPVEIGCPDRLVFMPGGRTYLAEVKATDGRLRPAQRIWHQRIRVIGHNVAVLSSIEEVDEWMDEIA